MDLGLRGKTAIVAAASRGLGKAVALALAHEGANVVVFSRGLDAIQQAAGDIAQTTGAQVLGQVADATRLEDLERVVGATRERFGSIHVVYNNAGGPKPGFFDNLSDQDWADGITVNTLAPGRILTERLRQIDQAEPERRGPPLGEGTRRKLAAIPVGRYG